MKRGWLAALVLAWGAAAPAAAGSQLADVTIYDRTEHRVLSVHFHESRRYVEGKPGNEYEVRVRNTSGAEILSVVSVDGVNVVSGDTANWNQTGYVIGAHSDVTIKGWRKSLERVAGFFFTEQDHSYAARTGRPENVGVIGVALFRKKAEPEALIGQGMRSEAQADSAQPSSPRAAEKRLGTGHGRSETSAAQYTSFERASSEPSEVIAIHYDSYRNLVAQSVIRASSMANPFPGQFVPDPR